MVRLVAPLLQNKWCDPGVVVVDEGGNFAVSLVGGHWGGANRLAREVAACLGAAPVVTTATDVRGKPAIDLLARQWGFRPVPGERVKVINSALLAGERVEIFSEWRLSGDSPLNRDEIMPAWGQSPAAACRSLSKAPRIGVSRRRCWLPAGCCRCRPGGSSCGHRAWRRALAAGEGSRRRRSRPPWRRRYGSPGAAGTVWPCWPPTRSRRMRPDYWKAAGQMGLGLKFFDSCSLRQVDEHYPGLQHSEFVQRQLGVGNVCETAALAAVPDGALVLPKTRFNRVTVALAEAGWLWSASGRAIRRT